MGHDDQYPINIGHIGDGVERVVHQIQLRKHNNKYTHIHVPMPKSTISSRTVYSRARAEQSGHRLFPLKKKNYHKLWLEGIKLNRSS